MRRFKQLLAGILCAVLMVSMSACGTSSSGSTPNSTGGTSNATDATDKFDKHITFSATSINLPENVGFMDDDIFKTFNEKFNFSYELTNITWETWDERDRLWISSGDMPDMLFWNFNLKDYKSYSKQGLVKALPANLKEKYPNLAAAMAKTGIADYLQNADSDNNLYMIPNIIYLNPPTETTDIILDPKVLFYRKDWAKEVGIEVGETVTLEQISDLAQAFINEDPGKNGAGKTVGITATPANMDAVFVQSGNAFFDQFYKGKDGKYAWGGFDESTLAGIKNLRKYYEMGIIDADYYAFKGKEHYEKFDSGIAGMFYDGASAANVDERFNAFKRSNPNIDPSEAIGLAVVVGDDGKFRGQQNVINYWAGLLFRPDLDDETMARILSILDYTCTEEGQRLIHCGIEGKDYKMNGDEIVITRNKDDSGNFVSIADLYPSYNFFFTKAVLPDDWSARDPSLPTAVREQAVNMFHVKEKNTDLIEPDYDIVLFDGEKKLKFPLLINDIITEIVVSGDDIDSRWNSFKADNQKTVQEVLDEINASLT